MANTSNQMYEMASHITRLYLHQVCLEPQKAISTIQRELRLQIFAGMTFNFAFFRMNVDPKQHQMYSNAEEMQAASEHVISFLGGGIDKTKIGAGGALPMDRFTHLVLFKRNYKTKRL